MDVSRSKASVSSFRHGRFSIIVASACESTLKLAARDLSSCRFRIIEDPTGYTAFKINNMQSQLADVVTRFICSGSIASEWGFTSTCRAEWLHMHICIRFLARLVDLYFCPFGIGV